MMTSATLGLTAITLTLAAATPVATPSHAVAGDPPGRIGRVSYLSGAVSFRADSIGDWSGVLLNDVVTTGNALWTDRGARAEVHVGSSAVRLAPQTEADFTEVSDHRAQIRLTQGSLYIRVRQVGGDETYEVDTPDGAISLLEAGHYRIDVSADEARSIVTVRDGDADVTSAGSGTVPLRTGESVALSDGSSAATTVAVDEWETWCAAQDRSENASPSLWYISPGFVGFEALDAYGTWEVDDALGPIWFPTVGIGWAPYRFGHWSWVGPWGWTWIDDAPWGFAPCHYGRWSFVRSRWAWVPGVVVPAPVYAPALVAFVGGSGFDLSLSFGSGGGVGWFPLAPGEVFIPGYRASATYTRSLNRTSVQIRNIDVTKVDVTRVQYANRQVPGAVTAVTRETFVRGAPVAKTAVRVPAGMLTRATVIGTTAPTVLRPERRSPAPLGVARPPAPRAPRTTAGAVDHWVGPTDATLRRQWQNERAQALARQAAERAELERRERAELSTPPAGVSLDQLRQRQAQERDTLERRHESERDAVDRRYRTSSHGA